MHPFGSYLALIQDPAVRGDDPRRAAEWRRLHRRPDAPPMDCEPKGGWFARLLDRMPIIGRAAPRTPAGEPSRFASRAG
jgi:hypothetical protein